MTERCFLPRLHASLANQITLKTFHAQHKSRPHRYHHPRLDKVRKKGCSELRRAFQSICSSLLHALPSDLERLNSEALSTGAHRALS